MQGVFRKLYMSILAATLILLTSIATTFAWVGMLTSSSLGSFDINLKVEDFDNEYYLKISGTDSTNSDGFGDAVKKIDVQKQIMDNMNIPFRNKNLDVNDDAAIDTYFTRTAAVRLRPTTTDKYLQSFKQIGNLKDKDTGLYDYTSEEMDGKYSIGYYKFDIYLTVKTDLEVTSSTEINANIFFKNIEDALIGGKCGGNLINGNVFKEKNVPDAYSLLPTLPDSGLNIDSANATRLAFAIYNPIKITDTYTNESPSNIIIYQKGTKYPTYNSTTGLYSFGGILPEEYNIAIKELEKMFDIDSSNFQVPSEALERANLDGQHPEYEDKLMTKENYHIWHSPNVINGINYLGVKNNIWTKMKITVYFWYEGWDADCINFIDNKSVSISLKFATDTKNNS